MSHLQRYFSYLKIPTFEVQVLRVPFVGYKYATNQSAFATDLRQHIQDVFDVLEPGCNRQVVQAQVVMALMRVVERYRTYTHTILGETADAVKWKVSWIRDNQHLVVTLDWRNL